MAEKWEPRLLTREETAGKMRISVSALSHGLADTAHLIRIQLGGKVFFIDQQLDYHIAVIARRRFCGGECAIEIRELIEREYPSLRIKPMKARKAS
ncbi:MAG: hypothetical protein AB1631_10205 [Acidobacteriota bacterium]